MTESSLQPNVIIPAFNEEATIRRCLDALGKGLNPAFKVVVACNGCTDNTEQIVESEYPQVQLVSTRLASKAKAIRLAEAQNIGFPRVYLDADIELSATGIAALIARAQHANTGILVVPESSMMLSSSSKSVKMFYDAWYKTPYVAQQGFGAGTYVLNESLRSRFQSWPELVADDGFIRSLCEQGELVVHKGVSVTVRAPHSLWQLIRIKTRSKYGNIELKEYLHNPHNSAQETNQETLSSNTDRSAFQSLNWQRKSLYYLVNAVALLRAYYQFKLGGFKWYRDHSNH